MDVVVGLTYARKKDSDNIDFLLLHTKKKGKWELPKGKAEEYETFEDAVRREIEEETHCANILDLRRLYSKRKWRKNFVVFSAEVNREEKICLDSGEHDLYCWASFKTSESMLHSPLDRGALRYFKSQIR
jgi:8-oxo-dGTP diphosphatase